MQAESGAGHKILHTGIAPSANTGVYVEASVQQPFEVTVFSSHMHVSKEKLLISMKDMLSVARK